MSDQPRDRDEDGGGPISHGPAPKIPRRVGRGRPGRLGPRVSSQDRLRRARRLTSQPGLRLRLSVGSKGKLLICAPLLKVMPAQRCCSQKDRERSSPATGRSWLLPPPPPPSRARRPRCIVGNERGRCLRRPEVMEHREGISVSRRRIRRRRSRSRRCPSPPVGSTKSCRTRLEPRCSRR